MKRLLLIFIICLYANNIQFADNNYLPQQVRTEYSNGSPTTLGIDLYVNSNHWQTEFIQEYQKLIRDTLYNDIQFRTVNFKKEQGRKYDKGWLGYTVITSISAEVVINNMEKYRGVEFSPVDSSKYTDDDYFLKATVYHEISHYYFYQLQIEMTKVRNVHVDQYYLQSMTMFPNVEMQYGAKFIEEGWCEYMIQKYRICPTFKTIHVPVSDREFQDKELIYDIQYKYASKFIRDFLDMFQELDGRPKVGLMILLNNRPPTYKEILKPELYYCRIKLGLQPNPEY
jgi:hypothetical protein